MIVPLDSRVSDGVTGEALLSTGRPVRVQLAESSDLDRISHYYENLSHVSSYNRFFGTRRRVPDAELRDVVAGDLSHHVALLATLDDQLIGIGEYITGGGDDAEVAFSVADEHHGEGVATLLLERLAIVAARSGLRRLTARALADNRDMHLVFRTVGLDTQVRFNGGEVEFSLSLSDLTELERQAAARHQLAAERQADQVLSVTE